MQSMTAWTRIAVADALAYAHSQRVIHRDLKPSNVLVGEFGETVVIDWGLAKDLGAAKDGDARESLVFATRVLEQDTVSGSVVGTPAYMPPEQARGESVDQRADVYALGALLYKLLSGSAPYVGESSADVLEQVKAGPPLPLDEREPGAPPPLVAIVDKAMARDPAARYATAAELAQDLKRFQPGQLVAAHRYTPVELVRRWLRRYRVVVAAALVLAVVGVVSVRRVVVERARAQANATDADQRRINLLEERGRTELLAGEAGKGLAYLVRAATDGATGGARGFLIADAMRPFEAQLARLGSGPLVATSSDGKYVATAGIGAISLWTSDGERVAILAADPARIHALVFDPAGTHVPAGADDDVAWVWGIDGKLVALLRTNRAIRDVAFSPDGKRLVTAGDAGLAIVWDIATGKDIATSSC